MSRKARSELSRPPRPGQDTETFIAGAERTPTGRYPWEDPALREDVARTFNVRLSEPTKAKLQWLADNTPQSMHQIAQAAVEAEIERLIQTYTEGEG